MKNKVLGLLKSIAEIWEKLPKEVRVAAYIAVSYGLADLANQLEIVKQNGVSIWVVFAINIILVFIRELRARIVVAREFIASKLSK